MTQNQRFYVEEIVNYLNLLNGEDIFQVSYKNWDEDSFYNGVKLSTTSSAYRHELAMLAHLIFDMTQCHYNLPETIELR